MILPGFRYALTGAYVSSAIYLINMLDPYFGEKITTLKELTSLLPFGSKPHERK